MIDLSEALRLVAEALGTSLTFREDDVVVLEDSTTERTWGWVFFYESPRFVETGDWSSQLAGNAPFIVERETGRLITTGTDHAVEYYIENYESTGDPHMRPGREIEIRCARENPDRLAAVRLLRRVSGLPISQTKRGIDDVVQGRPFRVTLLDRQQARRLRGELEAYGLSTQQLSEPSD